MIVDLCGGWLFCLFVFLLWIGLLALLLGLRYWEDMVIKSYPFLRVVVLLVIGVAIVAVGGTGG